jgi:hypothetical protein
MATLVQRKFGTDLSNVNQDAMAKRLSGKAKAASTHSSTATATVLPAPIITTAPVATPIDEEIEKLALQSDMIPFPPATPQATDISKSIYGLNFLLQFQKVFTNLISFFTY